MYESDVERVLIPVLIFLIPITAMLGAFIYLIVKMLLRARVRELEIRERIAMIERGLVPSPEADPSGFERAMARHDHTIVVRRRGSSRSRGAGVVIMGLGMALMVLIAFAGGEPGVGIGVGGALMILGLAFFLNSLMSGEPVSQSPERFVPPPPPTPGTSSAPAQPEQRLD